MSAKARRFTGALRAIGPVVLGGAGIGVAVVLGAFSAFTILTRVLALRGEPLLPNLSAFHSPFSRGDSIGFILIGVAVAALAFATLLLFARRSSNGEDT